MKKFLTTLAPMMNPDEQASAPSNGSNPSQAPAVIVQQPTTLASVTDDAESLMSSFLNGDAKFFSTIQIPDNATPEQRRELQVRIFNAISDAHQLSEFVNVPLCITDYMAHPVILTDQETGELIPTIRVLLVTEDGESYAAVSGGVQNSIERLRGVIGQAPWHPGIWMKVTSKAVRSSAVNKVLSISLLTAAEIKKLPTK